MARKKRMPTLWQVPDNLWDHIAKLIAEYDPAKETGRKRENARKILDALIFRFRTGCQWNHIPKLYGDDSTIHRTFQRWVHIGLFQKIWPILIEECEWLGKVDWQSVDASLRKARGGANEIDLNPTNRTKRGTKSGLLADSGGHLFNCGKVPSADSGEPAASLSG